MNLLSRLVYRTSPAPDPKVFFIGFNKCGTKTIHWFFQRNGVRSAHCRYHQLPGRGPKTWIAKTMQENLAAGRAILDGMAHYQAFSDLVMLTDTHVIEANKYFREMECAHPDALFIFNDRPVDAWIKSRLSHEGGPGGSFVGRYATALGLPKNEVPDVWREDYHVHKAGVLEYFSGNSRFLHFDITKQGAKDLSAFTAGHLKLRPWLWQKRGSAAERAKHYERRAKRGKAKARE